MKGRSINLWTFTFHLHPVLLSGGNFLMWPCRHPAATPPKSPSSCWSPEWIAMDGKLHSTLSTLWSQRRKVFRLNLSETLRLLKGNCSLGFFVFQHFLCKNNASVRIVYVNPDARNMGADEHLPCSLRILCGTNCFSLPKILEESQWRTSNLSNATARWTDFTKMTTWSKNQKFTSILYALYVPPPLTRRILHMNDPDISYSKQPSG